MKRKHDQSHLIGLAVRNARRCRWWSPSSDSFSRRNKNTRITEPNRQKKKPQSCCFTEPCTQLGFTKGLNCVLADIYSLLSQFTAIVVKMKLCVFISFFLAKCIHNMIGD